MKLFKRLFLGKYCYRLEDLESMYLQILLLYRLNTNNRKKECIELVYKYLTAKEISKNTIPVTSEYNYYYPYTVCNFKLSKSQIVKILTEEINFKSVYKKDEHKYNLVIEEINKLNKSYF